MVHGIHVNLSLINFTKFVEVGKRQNSVFLVAHETLMLHVHRIVGLWNKTSTNKVNRQPCKQIFFHKNFHNISDRCQQSPLKWYSRMRNWKDITGGDIQILFAHLLVVGIMKRGNAAKYWANCDITKLDFFGKYLYRNFYQMLLSNFYCTTNSLNPPPRWPGHDPLHKIRPFLTMCQENFHLKYRTGWFLSVDEGGCGFRGKVKFLFYNKDKTFWGCRLKKGICLWVGHLLWEKCYICAKSTPVRDPTCRQTTKTIVGLLDSVQL